MIVYPVNKEICIQIENALFYIVPLTTGQKANLLSCVRVVKGEEVPDGAKMMAMALKYALKRCEGIETADGDDYQVEFDKDGYATDECVDTLLTASTSLMLFSARLANGVIDHSVEGVTIKTKASKKKKRKK